MDSDTLNKSIEHLSKDTKFKVLIDKYDSPNFVKNDNYFHALSKSIVYQQLRGKVAKVIYNRFLDLFENREPDLQVIINLKDSKLREIGLSKQKTEYIKGLSKYFFNQGELIDFPSLTNEEISKELIKIKGIGQWTVDMFLMFTMFRPNVLPVADLGIKKGFQELFNLKELPSEKVMITKSKKWQPYRTIACCYLWKLVDDGDVW